MCGHRRRSIVCILPPQVLANIARNGTKEQREYAVHALEVDHSLRTTRLTLSLLGGMKVPQAAAALSAPGVSRTIYDTKHSQNLPGTLARAEGQDKGADASVNGAYDGLGDTFDFYFGSYHRNSIDNAGMPLVATVHYGNRYDNAFWNGQQMIFGDGDGELFNDFTCCLDVIGHELTHGVTAAEANLTYQGQPGALNESISDVFGSLVKQYKLGQTADKADWLIGAGLLAKGIKGVALRSMKAPGTAYDDPVLGKDTQPADMAHYVHTPQDNGGVHTNSGIPNHAFYLAATNMKGKAWEGAGQVWYDTVCDRALKMSATFQQFANLTAVNAAHRFGANSSERKAIIDAWGKVGITVKQIVSAVPGALSARK